MYLPKSNFVFILYFALRCVNSGTGNRKCEPGFTGCHVIFYFLDMEGSSYTVLDYMTSNPAFFFLSNAR